MAKADWTYQVPQAGAPSVGLEEYAVVDARGERVGKVMALLRRDGEVYVAVERGQPPVRHDLHAFRWDQVAGIDHDSLTVRLAVGDDALAAAIELDPARRTEGADADAVRLTELPRELEPAGRTGEQAGPTDPPSILVSIVLGLLGVFAALALVAAASAVDFTWHFVLFLIPVALLAAAALAGYRALRRQVAR